MLLSCTFNILQICLLQTTPKLRKVGKLLRDDQLVPEFLRALEEIDQPNVVHMLTREGLHTCGLLIIIHCAGIVCHHN